MSNKQIFQYLQDTINSLLTEDKRIILKLTSRWEDIYPEFYNDIKPNRLIWKDNHKAVLVLKYNNKSITPLVIYQKEQALKKCNDIIGYNCLIDIR